MTDVIQINDFTPGIYRFSRIGYPLSYGPGPLGSAAHAYRCIAREGIGLIPFPTYQVAQTYSVTDGAHSICLTLGNMMTLAARGGAVADIVSAFVLYHGTGVGAATDFTVTRFPAFLSAFTPTTVYSSTASAVPQNTTLWPLMDHGVFQDPTSQAYARTVITTDPISTSFSTTAGPGKWVTVRGWTTPTPSTAPESSNGNFTLLGAIGSYPRVFYHAARMGIWQVGAASTITNSFVSTDEDVLSVSGLLNPTTISTAGTFFPELGTFINAWGSFSTGEFVGIYQEGGAVLIYGDLFAPSQVIKLPGVVGANGAMGPMALSPIGAIYPRFDGGVYVWNGDSTSKCISRQVPDGGFTRTGIGNGFYNPPPISTSHVVWGDQVVFPNNWLFDTNLGSWWLTEDPNVINFQVFAANGSSILAAPGPQYASAGQPATINTYYWPKTSPSQSYFWLSNAIPVSQGQLVSITNVEIVASNSTAFAATIQITPQVPSGQTARAQQNPNQTAFFTIPAHSVNFRQSKSIGYTDYNIQLGVTANNPSAAAPTLHAINVAYDTRVPSSRAA